MTTRTAVLACLGSAVIGLVIGLLAASPVKRLIQRANSEPVVTLDQSDNMYYMESRVIEAARAVSMIDAGSEEQLGMDLERQAKILELNAQILATEKAPRYRRMMEHDIDTFLYYLNSSIPEGYRPSPHLLRVLAAVRESRRVSKYVADDEHIQKQVEAAYSNIPMAAR